MRLFLKCFAICLISSSRLVAQDGFDPLGEIAEGYLPKVIRVQVEFIEVPHQTLTSLLQTPRQTANDTDLREKLRELLDSGEANILETQVTTARSGQKCDVVSAQEYIFPTEYKSPAATKADAEASEASSTLPIIPDAFETKDLGSILMIEPTLDENDKFIDLRCIPELVYPTGRQTWADVQVGDTNYKIEVPEFYKMTLFISTVLTDGQPFFAGATSPKNERGEADFSKKVMIFIRADVLTLGR